VVYVVSVRLAKAFLKAYHAALQKLKDEREQVAPKVGKE